jgi:hypothetical protein
VYVLEIRVQGLGFRMQCLGCKIEDSGTWVLGGVIGFRGWSLGLG